MKKSFYTIAATVLTVFTMSASAQTITAVAGICSTPGYWGDYSAATAAALSSPGNSAFDAAGNLYIADKSNHVIRMVSPAGIITTVAGIHSGGYSGDGGQATNAKLYGPVSVTVDGTGNLYIADYFNHRIRKVTTAGIISTVAGDSSSGYSGDGIAATASHLNYPTDVALDASGNVLICDATNHRIRKVNSSGMISTIAGTGSAGFSGDGGAATAAKLNNPNGICTDATGNIYIADLTNNLIRKIDPAGTITSISATGSVLSSPAYVSIDVAGNLFIGSLGNNMYFRVSNTGVVASVAGTGTAGCASDGSSLATATFYRPTGITFDANNNMYLTVQGNSVVRKVDVSTAAITGITSVCIGNTTTLSSTITNGKWTSSNTAVASVGALTGIVTGVSTGTATINYDLGMYHGSQAVTVTNCALSVNSITGAAAVPSLFPNPSNGTFSIAFPESIEQVTVTILDIFGKEAATRSATNSSQLNFNLGNLPAGTYIAKIAADNKTYRSIITITK